MKRDLDSKLDTVKVVATDLNDAWFQCLVAVVEHGYVYYIDRGSYEGQHRLQIGKLNLRVRNPSVRPLIPQMPEVSNIPPPVDDQYINDYLPYIMTDTKVNEQYTYGQFINNWSGINQYQMTVEMIANNPGTNQATIAVCEPKSMLLPDPPCLRQIIVQIVDNYLCFHLTFRSWDLWGGLPGNLAVLQIMKEYMLEDINNIRRKQGKEEFKDGQLMAECPGAHIYDHNWGVAEIRLLETEGSILKKHKNEMNWKKFEDATGLLKLLGLKDTVHLLNIEKRRI